MKKKFVSVLLNALVESDSKGTNKDTFLIPDHLLTSHFFETDIFPIVFEEGLTLFFKYESFSSSDEDNSEKMARLVKGVVTRVIDSNNYQVQWEDDRRANGSLFSRSFVGRSKGVFVERLPKMRQPRIETVFNW